VAAFSTPDEAVQAAVRMQRAIQEFCRTDTSCGDLRVRIGVADGEVVLDKSGRPFLGSALNLAARIMDLADGGRVMISGSVAAALSAAPEYSLHSHGEFKLKNIAEPLPVFEALWDEGMEAQEIRAT
jgi:class 3 adenylate cyclase